MSQKAKRRRRRKRRSSRDLVEKIKEDAREGLEWDIQEGSGPVDDPLRLDGHFEKLQELLDDVPEVQEWAERVDEYPIFYPVGRHGKTVEDVWEDAYHDAAEERRERRSNRELCSSCRREREATCEGCGRTISAQDNTVWGACLP